jgi:hypothetical protein
MVAGITNSDLNSGASQSPSRHHFVALCGTVFQWSFAIVHPNTTLHTTPRQHERAESNLLAELSFFLLISAHVFTVGTAVGKGLRCCDYDGSIPRYVNYTRSQSSSRKGEKRCAEAGA